MNGIVMHRVNALPRPPGKRQLAETIGRSSQHCPSSTSSIVICINDEHLPRLLSFLTYVIDCNRNGRTLEHIKQERGCGLTVVKVALVGPKQKQVRT